MKHALAAYALPAAQELAEQMGFKLVDAELVKEPGGLFLRFFIDKPGGVTLDDCEAYHRRLLPSVETLEYDYMEVASPGADRPLKTPADFERARGVLVEARLYKAEGGAKRVVGVLKGVSDGALVLEDESGERRISLKLVAKVAPYIEAVADDQ